MESMRWKYRKFLFGVRGYGLGIVGLGVRVSPSLSRLVLHF